MIRRLRSDLGQVLSVVRPATVRTLVRAGVFGFGEAVGAAASAPWYLGRGPSLGVASQLARVAVGSKDAVRDRRGTLTWAELDRRANRAANALRAEGLRGNDRVALLLRNGRELVETLIGAQKVGIVACPLNSWARTGELRDALAALEPKLLVYDSLHAEQVEPALPDELSTVVAGGGSGRLDYEDWIGAAPDHPPFPFAIDRGSARFIIHTSGTTGKPKGAARDASVTGLREFLGLLETVPLRRDDVIYCPAPLFHSFGLLTLVLGTLLGATFVLPERFDPAESYALIEEHEATTAAMVPVMIRRMLSVPGAVKGRHDVSNLRIVLASGSAIPQDLRDEVRRAWGPVLFDLYGSTEAGWVAVASPEDQEQRPGTLGKPVAGVEVLVLSSEGDRLPPGEVGELYVRSGSLFDGYATGEDKGRRDGALAVGDLGRLDEEGYLFVEGRSDDMVVIGGENVYPAEVEDTIRAMDGVRDVAVTGVPDPEYGQVLVAFVVGDVDPGDVQQACRSNLASFKVPRRIEVVSKLPRTGTGKILKRELTGRVEPGGSQAKKPGRPRKAASL